MSQETMAPTQNAPHGAWNRAVVRAVMRPTSRLVMVHLEVENRVAHMPGQRYVVRLTAQDGYTASRSYSIASSPSQQLVELCVERVDHGEVSTHLVDVLEVGDELEVRGPIGGWFAWDGVTPALAIGGGTGVVPLVSMFRHARENGNVDDLCLITAARTYDELPYAEEIVQGCSAIALSREDAPPSDKVPTGRVAGHIRAQDLAEHIAGKELFFVCGSTRFAETASSLLVELGVPAHRIRVERFGAS
jgi:ferredoxin-NADP reductase